MRSPTARLAGVTPEAGGRTLCLVLCALALSVFARAKEPTITTFDAPGAGTGAGQGTTGEAINAAGAIAGIYIDASNVYHGFLRARNGAITTFDAAGAATGAGTFGLGESFPA